jgi:hypothetical protein
MKKQFVVCSFVLLALVMSAASFALFTPGQQTMVLAHNAYPEKGQYTDRFDRAMASGMPLVIEIDLTWGPNPKTGNTMSMVGDYPERRFKEITGDEPLLSKIAFSDQTSYPGPDQAKKEEDDRTPLGLI